MKTMFFIGFMTWGAEGVLLKGLDRYGTVGTGFWCGYGRGCSEYGTGTGAGTGTVRVRYGYGTGTVRARYRYGYGYGYFCTCTVPIPHPYPYPYRTRCTRNPYPFRTSDFAYRPASKHANRAVLLKLAK